MSQESGVYVPGETDVYRRRKLKNVIPTTPHKIVRMHGNTNVTSVRRQNKNVNIITDGVARGSYFNSFDKFISSFQDKQSTNRSIRNQTSTEMSSIFKKSGLYSIPVNVYNMIINNYTEINSNLRGSAKIFVMVLVEESVFKGYLFIVAAPREVGYFQIYDVFTIPEFRKSGVMARLFDQAREFIHVYAANKQDYVIEFGVLKSNRAAISFYYSKAIKNPGFPGLIYVEEVKKGNYPVKNMNKRPGEAYPFRGGVPDDCYWFTFKQGEPSGSAYINMIKEVLNQHTLVKNIVIDLNTAEVGADSLRYFKEINNNTIPELMNITSFLTHNTETGYGVKIQGTSGDGYNLNISSIRPGLRDVFGAPIYPRPTFTTSMIVPSNSPYVMDIANGHTHPTICYNIYGCFVGCPSAADMAFTYREFAMKGLPFHLIFAREGLYVVIPNPEYATKFNIGSPEANDSVVRYERTITERTKEFYNKHFTFYQFLDNRRDVPYKVRFQYNSKLYTLSQWDSEIESKVEKMTQSYVCITDNEDNIKYGPVKYTNNSDNFGQFLEIHNKLIEFIGDMEYEKLVMEHMEDYMETFKSSFLQGDQLSVRLFLWTDEVYGGDPMTYYHRLFFTKMREESKFQVIDPGVPVGRNTGQTNTRFGKVQQIISPLPTRVFPQ